MLLVAISDVGGPPFNSTLRRSVFRSLGVMLLLLLVAAPGAVAAAVPAGLLLLLESI